MVDVTLGSQTVTHLVSRPSQTAKLKVFAGMGQLQRCFKAAVFLQSLDEGIPIKQNSISLS